MCTSFILNCTSTYFEDLAHCDIPHHTSIRRFLQYAANMCIYVVHLICNTTRYTFYILI